MDWQSFLTDNQIDYVDRGPNTKRGEISIRCPWCGEDDPSQHLGISLTGENWGCLRDPSHRGHSSAYLIGTLLGCSQHQAKLVLDQYSRTDPDQLGELSLESVTEPVTAAEPEGEPKPEHRLIKAQGPTAKFWNYIIERGFDDPDALMNEYWLTCCLTGRFKDRLIIPFLQCGEVIAWTGRALGNPKTAPRYLSSNRVKETIFNADALMQGGKALFLTEGPFDALKMDYYGQALGVRATCALGVSLSIEQIVLLNSRRNRFARTVVLFDQDAVGPAYEAMDWLQQATIGQLPSGVKDPGDLTKDQVGALCNEYT